MKVIWRINAEKKAAGIVLLLIALNGLRGWAMAGFERRMAEHSLPEAFVQGSQIVYSADQILQCAAILGIPLVIGLAYAAGRVRLRTVLLLFAAAALFVLPGWQMLRAGFFGLLHGRFGESVALRANLCLSQARSRFYSEWIYGEAVLNALAGLGIACAARRSGGAAPQRGAGGKRMWAAVWAASAVLALLTVLSLHGVFNGLHMQAREQIGALGLEPSIQALWEARVQYLLTGGPVSWWIRPGGRVGMTLFCWVCYTLACLYGAGRLDGRRAAAMMGAAALGVLLAVLLGAAPEIYRSSYYEGLRSLLRVRSRPADFWLYRVPEGAVCALQLAARALSLLGAAALLRRCGARHPEGR